MTTPFHTTVSLDGFRIEESLHTFVIEGNVTANDVGKAVSLTGNANAVELAANNAAIVGRIEAVENRGGLEGNVATVARRFIGQLPWAPIANVADPVVGNTVVGAGSGLVKAAAADDPYKNFVVEVIGNTSAVVYMM